MNRLITFLLSLALSAPVLAQTDGTIVRRRDLFGGSVVPTLLQTTSSDLNYFVETTGNDSNNCTSTAATCIAPACAPCLTMQGAVDKIPKRIAHNILVKVGAGNFTGARMSGFDFTTRNGAKRNLFIQGALVNFVPGSGDTVVSGTATAGSAGVNNVYGTLTDTARTWTVDVLRGRLLEITGGTPASLIGTKRIVEFNTADTITIVGAWPTAPGAGTQYAVRDWATNCTTPVAAATGYSYGLNTISGSNLGDPMTVASGQLVNRCIVIEPTTSSGSTAGTIGVDGLRFTGANDGVVCSSWSGDCAVLNSRFDGQTLTNASVRVVQNFFASSVMVAHSYFEFVGGTGGVFQSNSAITSLLQMTGNLAVNGALFANQDGPYVLDKNSTVGQTIFAINVGPVGGLVFGHHHDCTGLGTFFIGLNSFTPKPIGAGTISQSEISNCPVVFSLAHRFTLNASTILGSGNTTGALLTEGAGFRINPAYAMTSGTDILFEGTPYTLAALRALVPKAIFGLTYGTLVYEQ